MTIQGVDYAWQKPSPAALVAAGKQFACRYLCGDPTNGKNLTAPEAKALSAAGIAIVSNWEWSTSDATGAANDYARGVSYATQALKMATACGMPAGRPIYFSVDSSNNDWTQVAEYFRGIRSVLGLAGTGVYGGYDTISHAVAGKWAAWFWQTFAWSAGRWHPAAHIQQYHNGAMLGGADLDLDRAMVNDYGQWTVGAVPTLEDDMFNDPDRTTLLAVDARLREFLKLSDSVPGDLSKQPFPLPAATAIKRLPATVDALAGKVDGLASELAALTDKVDKLATAGIDSAMLADAIRQVLRSGVTV